MQLIIDKILFFITDLNNSKKTHLIHLSSYISTIEW